MDWFEFNGQNHEKTAFISFSRKMVTMKSYHEIAGLAITRITCGINLWFKLESKLYINGHIYGIVSKIRRNLCLIPSIIRHFQHANSCLRLYQFIVRLILEYYSIVWNYDQTNESIEILKKKVYLVSGFSRCFLLPFLLPDMKAYSELKLPLLTNRKKYALGIYFYKIVYISNWWSYRIELSTSTIYLKPKNISMIIIIITTIRIIHSNISPIAKCFWN